MTDPVPSRVSADQESPSEIETQISDFEINSIDDLPESAFRTLDDAGIPHDHPWILALVEEMPHLRQWILKRQKRSGPNKWPRLEIEP